MKEQIRELKKHRQWVLNNAKWDSNIEKMKHDFTNFGGGDLAPMFDHIDCMLKDFPHEKRIEYLKESLILLAKVFSPNLSEVSKQEYILDFIFYLFDVSEKRENKNI